MSYGLDRLQRKARDMRDDSYVKRYPLGGGLDENREAPPIEEQKPLLSPEAVAEEQYQYYQDTFVPVEQKLARRVRTPGEINFISRVAGLEAGKRRPFDEFGRNVGRMGISMSPDQLREAVQYFDKSRTGAEAGAISRTRSGLYDQNLENLGNYTALGRGLASSTQSALTEAAASAQATKNANQAIDAQNKSAKVGLAVTAIATAATIF